MIIIPAIDLRGGRCVRLTQGQASAETVYSENPVAVAKQWYEAGAEMLHIVNLDGAMNLDDSKNIRVMSDILYQINLPIQFGGGVRALDEAQRREEIARMLSGAEVTDEARAQAGRLLEAA